MGCPPRVYLVDRVVVSTSQNVDRRFHLSTLSNDSGMAFATFALS